MRGAPGRRFGAFVPLSLVLCLVSSLVLTLVLSVGATAGSALGGAELPAAGRAPSEVPSEGRSPSGGPARLAAPTVDLPRPVHGERAVRLLGAEVDEAAALNGTTSRELVALLRSDPTVWLDTEGAIFYKDVTAEAPSEDPVVADAPLDQTFLLHSRPGAQRTILLDFDGGSASGTGWHAQFPTLPSTQPAWDPSGNGPGFDDAELAGVQTVWTAVAEDYAAFDVDVTTADPGAAGINRSSSADQVYGARVLVTPSAESAAAICSSSCGGVAYLSVFGGVLGGGGDGYGYRQPAWVFPQLLGQSPKNIAEAASHEAGHNLGLSHDANAGASYDSGHGAWAPIMGSGYSRPVTQWSQGDYTGATNREDDVAIITGVVGARPDEAGSGPADAAPLPAGPAYITGRGDVDAYLLGTCSGSVTVSANALASHADLDVKLTLLDSTGTVVTTADPASATIDASRASGMSAAITRTLAPGTYYAAVDGVGNGPWTTGYDDYGSLGGYTMGVTGCDGVAPTGAPSPPTGVSATADPAAPSVAVTWSPPADPGRSAVTGYELTRSGSATVVALGPGARSHTWSGLASSTSYTFTVTALNDVGPGPSATTSATTAAGTVPPSVPRNVTGRWDSLDQAAVLAFDPPASSGSHPVTGYRVHADGVLLGTVTTTASALRGLAPGPHTLGVTAVSPAGSGPEATVVVVTPPRPANDAFARRTALSGVTGSVTGTNLESSAEPGEPSPPATDAGGASLWYSWRAPATGPVSFSTGSAVAGRDTTLAAYTGSSLAGLTQVAGDDGRSLLSSVEFTATAGRTYALAVDGFRAFAAGVGPFSLSWAGTEAPPVSTTTTLAVAVTGRSATLTASVSAPGGAPVGRVDFRDAGAVVGSGRVSAGSSAASITLTDLLVGDHSFRATFVPDDVAALTGSQSALVAAAVAEAKSASTTRISAPRTARPGTRPVVEVRVLRDAAGASGNVVLRYGTRKTTVGLTSGRASVKLRRVRAGTLRLTSTYKGNATTEASSARATIRVRR